MTIRQLSKAVINQIAAGEVVERPASVVKELVENAIDAHADRIEIIIVRGGKSLIRIIDNGDGIPQDELILAISRHCTSKLKENIHDIRALGFRGEALPSIASVSRLRLLSRTKEAEIGAEILVNSGKPEGPPRPAAAVRGTVVDVRNLFYITPARLKFLKTDKAETIAIIDIVKRIAIAFPYIRFTLTTSTRAPIEFRANGCNKQAITKRLAQIIGLDFVTNAITLNTVRENVHLTGFVSIPAYSRANNLMQFSYVNGRSIKDKMLSAALRAAYRDMIARDRYAVAVLFLTLDPAEVDVNVHPTKTDVRFRNPVLIRNLIIEGIREALVSTGIRSSVTKSIDMLNAFRSSTFQYPYNLYKSHFDQPSTILEKHSEEKVLCNSSFLPLGTACAQIHKTYIVSQTADSLIIVDQHAAHERLVYEALKQALYASPLPAQIFLTPEIINLSPEDIERLLEHVEEFERFGLLIEEFGHGALAVRGIPVMLGKVKTSDLIKDLVDEIIEHETSYGLKSMLDHIAATMACHSSIRSGKILNLKEMNALLRQMEKNPDSSTCNHGRPTWIELKLTDIERLFGRR